MAQRRSEQDDWQVVYLRNLLFAFNFFFWAGGAAVMAVGVWTLAEKSGYLSVLASSTFATSAYTLISAGALVMATGFLGCAAVLREQRGCLSTYFCLLFIIFLMELVAGVLAHVYYQRLSEELKQHLNRTLAESYGQPKATEITASVDRLQQDFKCCGSNSSADWQHSAYVRSREAQGRRVPDSCCKTVVAHCGQRVHPSNIYKVEGGCITKLEQFLADHLLVTGAVGIGVACLQAPPRAVEWPGPETALPRATVVDLPSFLHCRPRSKLCGGQVAGQSALCRPDLWDDSHLLPAPEAPAALLLKASSVPF